MFVYQLKESGSLGSGEIDGDKPRDDIRAYERRDRRERSIKVLQLRHDRHHYAQLGSLDVQGNHIAFEAVDKLCAGVFIVDYVCRWATADYKFKPRSVWSFVKYPFTPMAVIDLLSILPSFFAVSGGLKALRCLRLARTMRVFRVFKLVRHSKNLIIIGEVLKASRAPLAMVSALALGYIFISALVMLNVEPDTFDSFFDALYWATVSLTTVGYGDIYPVSNVGRLIAMVSSAFGIAVVALPAGIITAGYMKAVEEPNEIVTKESKDVKASL